jgi:hypothetical protein
LAPPDVLRVDEKNLREYSVLNCCGVIITTNHKSDGIFLPADDRRHFVAWSDLDKESFDQDYWTRLWTWYADGGIRHVAAYLMQLDIATFNAKAPPPKTEAFWDVVNAGRTSEDAELADALDLIGNPAATTPRSSWQHRKTSPTGSATAKIGASSRIASRPAAMSPSAIPIATPACGSLTGSGKSFMPKPKCRCETVLPPLGGCDGGSESTDFLSCLKTGRISSPQWQSVARARGKIMEVENHCLYCLLDLPRGHADMKH